MVQKWTVRRYV
jgi:lysosomal acid lipase/cholesteryl ester hydrolase